MHIPPKVVFCGPSGVGKTAYAIRLLNGAYSDPALSEDTDSTFGANRFDLKKGPFPCRLCDTSGNPNRIGLKDAYFLGASAFLIMFDLTQKGSLEEALKEKDFIRTQMGFLEAPILVCGTKLDSSNIQFTGEERREIQERCESQGFSYFEISSKEGINVEGPMSKLAQVLT